MSSASILRQPPAASAPDRARAAERFAQVRAHSLHLASTLTAEDQCVQSMPDASPTKWHLAHTSWFFEAVVLGPHAPATAPSIRRSRASSTPTTSRWGRATRGRSAACSRGPRWTRSMRTARMSMRPCSASSLRPTSAPGRRRAAARAWAAARAAAPGADRHRHPARVLVQSRCCPRGSRRTRRRCAWPALPRRCAGCAHRRRRVEIGHAGDGFAFDNETPRHRGAAAAVRAGGPPGHLRRVPAVHRGRRLRAARAVAVRRLGGRAGARLVRAGVLAGAGRPAGARRRLAGVRRRTACAGSTRPRPSPRSASTRRPPMPTGPARACRPSSSGRRCMTRPASRR